MASAQVSHSRACPGHRGAFVTFSLHRFHADRRSRHPSPSRRTRDPVWPRPGFRLDTDASRVALNLGAAASGGGRQGWEEGVNGRDKAGRAGEGLVLSTAGAVELGAACSANDHHPPLRLRHAASQECHEKVGLGGQVRQLCLAGVAVMLMADVRVPARPSALVQMSGPQANSKERLCPLHTLRGTSETVSESLRDSVPIPPRSGTSLACANRVVIPGSPGIPGSRNQVGQEWHDEL